MATLKGTSAANTLTGTDLADVLNGIAGNGTGFPVESAPRSVTTAARTWLQAGMLSTFAMLRRTDAETFLQSEKVR